MNALKTRFIIFLTLLMLVFAVPASARVPKHVAARRLAPNHSVETGAGKAELAELRKTLGPPTKANARQPPSEPIRNVYFTPTPNGAFTRMAQRLPPKNAVSMSAKSFERLGNTVRTADLPPPTAGKVRVQIFRREGMIELRFPNRTEVLSLHTIAGKEIDRAQMKAALEIARDAFYQSAGRPDALVQAVDGSFEVYAADIPIKILGPDHEGENEHMPKVDRIVQTPPARLQTFSRRLPRAVQRASQYPSSPTVL